MVPTSLMTRLITCLWRNNWIKSSLVNLLLLKKKCPVSLIFILWEYCSDYSTDGNQMLQTVHNNTRTLWIHSNARLVNCSFVRSLLRWRKYYIYNWVLWEKKVSPKILSYKQAKNSLASRNSWLQRTWSWWLKGWLALYCTIFTVLPYMLNLYRVYRPVFIRNNG